MKYRYIMLLRPASSVTLPRGVRWEFDEVPAYLAGKRPDLPVSKHPHGVVSLDRELTDDEREHFDLREAS